MMLRFSAISRFVGLTVALSVPAVVVACTSETSDPGGETPSPSASSTSTAPEPTATSTSTATPPPEKEAGVDAAKDAGPPPTDVAGSAECNAYCARMKSQCNKTCDPAYDCKIDKGNCAASTQRLLDCKTTKGQWYCGADGFSIVHSCKADTSVCP